MEVSKSMRVEVSSRETIKPSSPSPNADHQGVFKLSLLDQFASPKYVPALLFYKDAPPPTGGSGGTGSKEEVNKLRSQRLKSSLSETLSRFYPVGGRLRKDPYTITCNDEGVNYMEAQVLNCSLFHVLDKPNQKQLQLLMPDEGEFPDLPTRPLLLVQVSFFECGGMALGVKISHIVADAVTAFSFINGWAGTARGNVINPVTPDFSASTLFPPIDSLPPSPQIIPQNQHKPPTSSGVETCRIVFGPSALAAIQAKATSTENPRPSRFEAVSAFLVKILMEMVKESRPELNKKPSRLGWPVNLRSKLGLQNNCFGNLVGVVVHEVGRDVDGIEDMSTLAGYLRCGTTDICQAYIQALNKEGESVWGILDLQMRKRIALAEMRDETIHWYGLNSRCKLPVYEADFGWGKPLWVTRGATLLPHMIGMMDTRDGNGIEVMVFLTEEEMTRFESNQELKNYAAFNPSAFS